MRQPSSDPTRRSILRGFSTLGSISLGSLGLTHIVNAQVQPGFIGDVELREKEKDGNVLFELIRDFGYIDSNSVRWQAKAGLITDGASIPPVFWPIVGNPFQGLYLKAAVIHDYYCIPNNRYRKWEAVHRVFYDGMLKNGVEPVKATLMYFAVWRFGPRWAVSAIKPCTPGPGEFCASVAVSTYQIDSEDVVQFDADAEKVHLQAIRQKIEREKPALDDVAVMESNLPQLKRKQSTLKIDANTDQGWFFKNPNQFPLL